MGLGLVAYLVGEADYQSWQRARYQAAQIVYQFAAPSRVNAGYELNGVSWILPEYARSGQLPPRAREGGYSAAFVGPNRPQYILGFALPTEAGLGVSYQSIVDGKIIIRLAPTQ
jgi:hypothetical protein